MNAAGAAVETPASPEPAAAPAPSADPNRIPALQRSIQQRERTLVQKTQELNLREQQLKESVAAQVERAVAERMGKFKEDPIAQLKAMGFDEQTIATRLLKGNAPQPEELARQALEKAQQLEKTTQEREQRMAAQAAERAVADEAFSGKYEHLETEWTRPEVVREAYAVVGQLRARGIDPSGYSYEDICNFLNKRAASREKVREQKKAERAKKATPQGESKDGSNGSGQGEAPKTASTTTLGKGLGARQSLNGKPGHLMTNDELARAVEAEVARRASA